MPCQLEKVGDVSDRLYYDDVEKAWCIEKNVETKEDLTILSWVTSDTSKTETIRFRCSISDRLNGVLNLLNNRIDVKNVYSLDEEGVFGSMNTTDIYFRISKTTCRDLDSFKQYLKNNNVLLKYQLATPQKIVLPLSTQIALNSFFGTTHIYMESGEVEGTIKCKIPKSIGATVQSLNNKTDILSDRIEAIEGLKDSQNMKYETDKGYLVCKETKNGVIDDLKLEGRTLVNLCPKYVKGSILWISNTLNSDDYGFVTANADGTWLALPRLKLSSINNLKPSTKYTLVIEIKSNTLVGTGSNCMNFSSALDVEYAFKNYIDIPSGSVGTFVYTVNTLDSFENVNYLFRSQLYNTFTEGSIVYRWYLLEGDHTQNPPSYFEGLMSVGQDVDKIEVLSNNGNLVSNLIQGYAVGGSVGNTLTPTTNATYNYIKANAINGKMYYKSKGTQYFVFYTDENLKILKIQQTDLVNLNNDVGAKYIFTNVSNTLMKQDIVITPNSSLTVGSVNHQSDKKQILFYNENGELEPIQELHEWDSIEKHSDNKWYYHKRSGKVVLNGSENWKDLEKNSSFLKMSLQNYPNDMKYGRYGICDKFTFMADQGNSAMTQEFISTTGDKYFSVLLSISASKLSSQDVQGFKQWLQANNVTVVYQLAEEEVYELAPLHLDSYANETLILCNSGAISPKMEFSITSHINELVKAYGERINLLEEKVYKYMVTQNRMQLASTYSADSVTFKVDYFSLCGDEENYNEDLYNLILNNILVGKDNYDYDRMFTMILDYASWNQISWEQFDILVGLMDIQHNPPIEELSPEDVIEEDIIENETPVE